MPPWWGDAGARRPASHQRDAAGAVQADGAGHSVDDVTVTITTPVEFGDSYTNGTDNTEVTTVVLAPTVGTAAQSWSAVKGLERKAPLRAPGRAPR